MTTNPDKYIDEIWEIRSRHVEETQNEPPEKRAENIRKESEEFQRLVDKKRAEKFAAR